MSTVTGVAACHQNLVNVLDTLLCNQLTFLPRYDAHIFRIQWQKVGNSSVVTTVQNISLNQLRFGSVVTESKLPYG